MMPGKPCCFAPSRACLYLGLSRRRTRARTQHVQSLHKLFDDTLVSCSDSTSTPNLVVAIQPRPEPANVKGVAPSHPVLFSEASVVQDHYA